MTNSVNNSGWVMIEKAEVFASVVSSDVWKSKIFCHLSPKDLTRASLVCKQWFQWISDDAVWRHFDVNALFPKIKIECMDAEFWKTFVNFAKLDEMEIDLSTAPAITKRQIIGALARIKGAATATIVTMPQGYSTAKLQKLMKLYKEGEQIKMTVHSDPSFWRNGIEDTCVKKPYTFVAVSDYKGKGEDIYITEIERAVQTSGLELAQILEITTLNFFRAISSDGKPPTYVPYAICTERGRFFPFALFHRSVYVETEAMPHMMHIDYAEATLFSGSCTNFVGVKRF
jgi:hypothetical protein